MLRFLPLLFIAGIALEIASIIWIGGLVGILPTLLLLLAGGVIGVGLFRSAGANMVETLRSPIQQMSLQRGLAARTMFRVLAGLLFILPGFFSDTLGALLLLPPLQRILLSKVRVETFSSESPPTRHYTTVIEGEAVEITAELDGKPTPDRRVD